MSGRRDKDAACLPSGVEETFFFYFFFHSGCHQEKLLLMHAGIHTVITCHLNTSDLKTVVDGSKSMWLGLKY